MSANKIINRYNPEHDINPSGPPVTWAEYELALEIEKLKAEIEQLRQKVNDLKALDDLFKILSNE